MSDNEFTGTGIDCGIIRWPDGAAGERTKMERRAMQDVLTIGALRRTIEQQNALLRECSERIARFTAERTAFNKPDKFGRFRDALEALCREHGVYVCAGGYEVLEVWNVGKDDDDLIGQIDDFTDVNRSGLT